MQKVLIVHTRHVNDSARKKMKKQVLSPYSKTKINIRHRQDLFGGDKGRS